MHNTVYLTLENGQVFTGKSFGMAGETIGELVFTTEMVGCLETLSDPSYFGQIVVQTFPLIGNYGVIPADLLSESCRMRAYIVREWCQVPSNFRCEGDLDTFLKNQGIIGLYDIDTRELTKVIRENGVMNAKISASPVTDLSEIKAYRIENAIASVADGERSVFSPEMTAKRKVVLWDFGAKKHFDKELLSRGCEVVLMPYNATAEEILAERPDGILLSDGPGDPTENEAIVKELKAVFAKKLPIFGIGLGHELLALSQGGTVSKLHYGHRGANQPVKDLSSGRVYITSQNHGYTVETLPANSVLTHQNVNDHSCEGLRYNHIHAFSVQFIPQTAIGPQDTGFLFDQFVRSIDHEKSVRL